MATTVEGMLQKGWGVLGKLGAIKKVSVLRYINLDDGQPHLGIEPLTEQVSGLTDIDAYVTPVSVREVIASQGKIELTDMLFIFLGQEILETDEIFYSSKTYDIVQFRFFDPSSNLYGAVGRAV